MASRTSRGEWVRGLPSAFGVGRNDRKRVHSASERSVGYVFLIEESVQNYPNPHPYQTGSKEIPPKSLCPDSRRKPSWPPGKRGRGSASKRNLRVGRRSPHDLPRSAAAPSRVCTCCPQGDSF